MTALTQMEQKIQKLQCWQAFTHLFSVFSQLCLYLPPRLTLSPFMQPQ